MALPVDLGFPVRGVKKRRSFSSRLCSWISAIRVTNRRHTFRSPLRNLVFDLHRPTDDELSPGVNSSLVTDLLAAPNTAPDWHAVSAAQSLCSLRAAAPGLLLLSYHAPNCATASPQLFPLATAEPWILAGDVVQLAIHARLNASAVIVPGASATAAAHLPSPDRTLAPHGRRQAARQLLQLAEVL